MSFGILTKKVNGHVEHLRPAQQHLRLAQQHLRPGQQHLRPARQHLQPAQQHLQPGANNTSDQPNNTSDLQLTGLRNIAGPTQTPGYQPTDSSMREGSTVTNGGDLCLTQTWSIRTHVNFFSLSAKSEERDVKSTENLSKFTFMMRQWMVIPTCSGRP